MLHIYPVDEDYNRLEFNIPFSNLQWSRKYYDFGQFSVTIPFEIYASLKGVDKWKYIRCQDRPEVGVIDKTEYSTDNGIKSIQLSGFFAEHLLDSIVSHPRFTHNFTKTEETIAQLTAANDVLGKRDIKFIKNDTPLGNRTESDFVGAKLGSKIYSILTTRELSYFVQLSDEYQSFFMKVWRGVDRTFGQKVNEPYTFSEKYGNITKATFSIDRSAYANVCILDADEEKTSITVGDATGRDRYETYLDKNSESKKDDQTQDAFVAAMRQEAEEQLKKTQVSVTLDVENEGSKDYREKYDLGDIVNVIIDTININAEMQIVEASEVIKSSGHEVTLGFGTKRVSKIERALT